jgi:uncharacterized protein
VVLEAIPLHVEHPYAEWPRDLLDVGERLRTGWRPHAFRQFIVKVNSRCNLACDYCYVYRSADQSWREQPVRMARDTVIQTARRIAEHARAHGLARVEVILHGGEPLLAGTEFVEFFATPVRSAAPDVRVDLPAQTNATLLDERMLAVLGRHGVRLGVSLDGDRASHDAHRRQANGRGSYRDLVAGLERLRTPAHRDLFTGLLCVVDPRHDPVAVYEHLLEFEPPAVDLLLPHANWSNPPRREPGASPTPFGDWLIAVFDRWYGAERRETSIRLFDEIIRGVLGHPSRVESIGLSPARLVVVETDGSIEQNDSLKSCYAGAAHTGFDVHRDTFDDVLSLPQLVARQIGAAALSETCQGCDIRDVCGGGFFPHRYRQGSGFLNPSVYCDDLGMLIRHIRRRVHSDLAPG